jgi:hypothetical protein
VSGSSVDIAFILGSGRCGSSLIHEILARHPDVAFVSNLDDRLAPLNLLGRWNGQVYRSLPPQFSVKGRLRFAPSEGYRLLDRQVSQMISEPNRDLTADDVTPWMAHQLKEFFAQRAQRQGGRMVLHKFTGWPRARFLDAVFPGARFIHIVRDGRAVASSWLQMPWWRGYRGPDGWQWGPLPGHYGEQWDRSGQSFVCLAGIGWMLLMDAFEAAAAALPAERWLQLRYEDVVKDPREQHRRMLDFLGLGWNHQFEAALDRVAFSESRQDAFRRDLRADQVSLLESVQQRHLARLGYSLTGAP